MKTLIAVIAYNEAPNLAATLQDLADHNCGFDVVVVDNGSSDSTVQIARDMGVPVVAHCVNSGCSMGTVTSYLSYGWQRGYDVLCQFDGDGQHLAAELPKIIDPVLSARGDYVIGSRFLTGEGFQSTAVRRLGIRLFSRIDSWIMRQEVTDVTSGFRAYSRGVMEFFGHRFRYEIHDTNQLLLLSHFSGARVLEVPVIMRERTHGESEFDFITSFTFPFKGLVNIGGVLLQRRLIRERR
jgi:glycosyltransferase involved in cell wall biosynthesis